MPDAVKGEFVNVGVVLATTDETGAGFGDLQLTRDWKRARCLDPELDVEYFESLERELREALRSATGDGAWLLHRIQDTFSNAVEVTRQAAVLTDSPVEELQRLAEAYLEGPKQGSRTISGRESILRVMRTEFERQGVYQFLRKRLPVAEYTLAGDPLKIDYSYRPNGTVKMFHAVSLDADVSLARGVALSYPRIRAGIRRKEDADTQLTAVIESQLDRGEASVAFALNLMRENEMIVKTVADLPQMAERVREELKL
jgi:hypothetical protein